MNIDKILRELAEAAQADSTGDVDVMVSVMRTLARQLPSARLDFMPVIFAGSSLALAAILVIAFLPDWQTVSDPWASLTAR